MLSLFRGSTLRLAFGFPARNPNTAKTGGGRESPDTTNPEANTSEISGEATDEHSHVCEICQESLPSESFIQLDCSHRFCVDCLGLYGEITVKSKNPVKCPAPRCGQHISAGTCELFLDRETQPSLLLLLAELSIPEKERYYCPRKECSLLMVAEHRRGAEPKATCPGCGHDVCIPCKAPWHKGMTCRKFKAVPAGKRGTEEFQLHELARAHGWRQCRKCKHLVEREEGCNHMTCRCNAEWCYNCGRRYIWSRQLCKC